MAREVSAEPPGLNALICREDKQDVAVLNVGARFGDFRIVQAGPIERDGKKWMRDIAGVFDPLDNYGEELTLP